MSKSFWCRLGRQWCSPTPCSQSSNCHDWRMRCVHLKKLRGKLHPLVSCVINIGSLYIWYYIWLHVYIYLILVHFTSIFSSGLILYFEYCRISYITIYILQIYIHCYTVSTDDQMRQLNTLHQLKKGWWFWFSILEFQRARLGASMYAFGSSRCGRSLQRTGLAKPFECGRGSGQSPWDLVVQRLELADQVLYALGPPTLFASVEKCVTWSCFHWKHGDYHHI